MEASIQFIIESPQYTPSASKRTRLVTSCDSCRSKKIKCSQSSDNKCIQPSPDTRCKACKASKIPCSFKDRERYFAERSRAIAGRTSLDRGTRSCRSDVFTSSGSSSPSSISHRHSPKEPIAPMSPGLDTCRYAPYSADSRRQTDYSRHSMSGYHSRHSSMGYDNIVGPSSADVLRQIHNTYPPQPPMHSRYIQLFDSDYPERPHPGLMMHLFQGFFNHYASQFTFLTYGETITNFLERRLCPALSNCIAALAVRHVNIPELVERGLHEVAETYAENAKTILSSVPHMPSMERLHALLLLSWVEYKSDRTSGFRHYFQLATRMAMDLGLSDQSPPSYLPDSERICHRATWASLLQLHLLSPSR